MFLTAYKKSHTEQSADTIPNRPPLPQHIIMSANNEEQTPLLSLLSLLQTSIHTIEAELKEAQLPPFSLEPRWHPLDAPDAIASPRLYEARKVAMASANMIKALVQDVGTTLFVRA